MNKLMKKQEGITLIALVVTIIVLLILAGISIMMITGQSGILSQARAAKEDTRGGEVKDAVALAVSENTMTDYTGNGKRKSRQEVIDQLHKEGKLTDDEVTWLEEHDQITIGSIETDFSALGDTKEEKLENLYYLVGDYNNGKIENISLYFMQETSVKIMTEVTKENPDKFMTEEELILKQAIANRETNATSFGEYMKELKKQYTTAREFIMKEKNKSEAQYKLEILYLRAMNDENYKNLRVEDSSGNQFNDKISINGQGEHTFTVKLNGEEIKKFTININQYEIICVRDRIHRIVVYDLKNGKILKIDGGEYNYVSNSNGEKNFKLLTSEDIKTEEGIESYLEIPQGNTTYKYKLECNNIIVEGYHYEV